MTEWRQIVEESLEPRVIVAKLAKAYGLRPNQIFHWRKLYREGHLGGVTHEYLPVRITKMHEERFQACSPSQVYAALLDEGRYYCSVRTMYRIIMDQQAARANKHFPWFRGACQQK